MDEARDLPAHVLIFPLPLQGPVNSMFKLAELLCISGLHVTFVVTDFIHARLIRYTNIHSRLQHYPGFQLRTISDGLPDDHPRAGVQFLEFIHSMKVKTKTLLKDMIVSDFGFQTSQKRRPVSCIVADGILGFPCDVAKDIGIPVFSVRTISACCLWVFFSLPELIRSGEFPFPDDDLGALLKSIPGTESFLRRRDLPSFFRSGGLDDPNVLLYKTEREENSRADGLILNTFEELEEPILSQMRSVCPNVYAIGPLHTLLKTKLASRTTSPPAASSSSSLWEEDRSCIAWLDSQPPKSVIYVSFGSVATLTKAQLMEFWHGLVNSEQRFLWVIRPDSVAGKDWEESMPAELREKTKERGYIVGWAPQEEVLAHEAVGGFLTHSGWNSTLESIYEGVPMICWAYFLDQLVNSRFVERVWRLGLDMKDKCDRFVIEKMVRNLMEVRKEEFRGRAEEMANLAKKCLSEGGSSYCNLERLVKDIQDMTMAGRRPTSPS